jgi:hypothetical protein
MSAIIPKASPLKKVAGEIDLVFLRMINLAFGCRDSGLTYVFQIRRQLLPTEWKNPNVPLGQGGR